MTALMIACAKGHTSVVNLLLTYPVELDAHDGYVRNEVGEGEKRKMGGG